MNKFGTLEYMYIKSLMYLNYLRQIIIVITCTQIKKKSSNNMNIIDYRNNFFF